MPHKLIKNISEAARNRNLLDQLVRKFAEEFNMKPVIGAEIEFYLLPETDQKLLQEIFQPKKERGNGQMEIDILPQENFCSTINEIARIKQLLKDLGVCLDSKPYEDDYGSSMHFHINFLDKKGNNIFDNKIYLENSAKILCQNLKEHFLIFAPKEEDYKRFDAKFMAPTHICFGGNNRSVAIRIPDASPRRLEHRISSPQTDEYLAACAILGAIYNGFKNPESIKHYDKIYGNAYDDQYILEKFPSSLREAIDLFEFRV